MADEEDWLAQVIDQESKAKKPDDKKTDGNATGLENKVSRFAMLCERN